MINMKKNAILGMKSKIIAGAVALGMIAGAAYAQRDPAYQSARTNGQIGEQKDGYLGTIGSPSSDVQAMTSKINILRKQVYTKTAVAQSVSVETAAFLGGCKNIERTVAGEKYQAADGSWQTRTEASPQLDPGCPL